MAMKLYYSSGNNTTNVFQKEVGLSIGGFQTSVEMVSNDELNNLFGTVSNAMMDDKYQDYKCVFLVNDATPKTGLSFYLDVPVEAGVTNPDDLAPAPSNGDMWIVPEGGEGDWKDKDYKWATYNGSDWSFQQQPSSDFEVGFLYPTTKEIVIDGGTISANFVDPIEYPQKAPFGVTFVSANGVSNIVQIGDGVFGANEVYAIWIRRKVRTLKATKDDYTSGEGGLVFWQTIPLVFSYD